MWTTKFEAPVAALVAMLAVTGGGFLAQQPQAPKPKNPVAVARAPAEPADTAEMAKAEAKLAEIRELVGPRAGEHVANMAKIAWERDPWEAAVRAAREGKPVLSYAECAAGVPCGYG